MVFEASPIEELYSKDESLEKKVMFRTGIVGSSGQSCHDARRGFVTCTHQDSACQKCINNPEWSWLKKVECNHNFFEGNTWTIQCWFCVALSQMVLVSCEVHSTLHCGLTESACVIIV